MFVVETGSGTGQREPTYVDLDREVSDATFDATGALYLVGEGGLFVYRAGSGPAAVTPLEMPEGAPAPDGPIVWIP